jgi:predicted MFS family arabinose efflux permease
LAPGTDEFHFCFLLSGSGIFYGQKEASTFSTKFFPFLVGTKLLNPFSERLVVMIAFQFIAITALTLPFVSNLFLLYVNQIVHGIGRGFAYSILMGFVFRLVSSDERATAMGVFQSIYSLGIFTGPIVGGWVGSFWGVNGIFVMSGVSTLMAIPLLWRMKIVRGD